MFGGGGRGYRTAFGVVKTPELQPGKPRRDLLGVRIGWGQIQAYGAFGDLSQDQTRGTAASKGDFGFKLLTSRGPAAKTARVNVEPAKGRLALRAVICI